MSRVNSDPPTIKLKLENPKYSPNPLLSPTLNSLSPIVPSNPPNPNFFNSPINPNNPYSSIKQYNSNQKGYTMDENDFQQMIANQQLQFNPQTKAVIPHGNQNTNKYQSGVLRSNPATSPNRTRHSSRGKRNEDREPAVRISSKPRETSQVDTENQEKISKLTEETLARKNRVLEEISRRYETQIEQLTFALGQKDEFFENQRIKWEKSKQALIHDFESRESDLLEEIEEIKKRREINQSNFNLHNPSNNSQSISLLNSQKNAAERSKNHRKIEKLEAENKNLQEQLNQANEKLERAENVVKMMEHHKQMAEKKSEKIKDKFDKDRELNQLSQQLKDAEESAQSAIEQANRIRNENFELKKLNAQLKKMNERYFAVLRALNESEKVILQKESELHQLMEKYQQLSRRFKNPRSDYDQSNDNI